MNPNHRRAAAAIQLVSGGGELITDGLLHHWKLDETSGLIFADSVGGVATQGTRVNDNDNTGMPGMIDGAAYFPTHDLDNVIAIDTPFQMNTWGAFSVTGWAYPTSWNNSDCNIFMDESGHVEMRYDVGDGYWEANIRETGGDYNYAKFTQAAPVLNTWTHVGISYVSGALKVYVNGVVGSVVGAPPSIRNGTDGTYIGGDLYSRFWAGYLDDIRVYDRVLTPAEFAAIANLNG